MPVNKDYPDIGINLDDIVVGATPELNVDRLSESIRPQASIDFSSVPDGPLPAFTNGSKTLDPASIFDIGPFQPEGSAGVVENGRFGESGSTMGFATSCFVVSEGYYANVSVSPTVNCSFGFALVDVSGDENSQIFNVYVDFSSSLLWVALGTNGGGLNLTDLDSRVINTNIYATPSILSFQWNGVDRFKVSFRGEELVIKDPRIDSILGRTPIILCNDNIVNSAEFGAAVGFNNLNPTGPDRGVSLANFKTSDLDLLDESNLAEAVQTVGTELLSPFLTLDSLPQNLLNNLAPGEVVNENIIFGSNPGLINKLKNAALPVEPNEFCVEPTAYPSAPQQEMIFWEYNLEPDEGYGISHIYSQFMICNDPISSNIEYSDPTSQECVFPAAELFPPPPNGAMQFLTYEPPEDDYHTITAKFAFKSAVDEAESTFLQLYESDLGVDHQYFGVQTDATFGGGEASQQLLIFSKFILEERWGESQEVRTYGDSTINLDQELGTPFVSLRRVSDLNLDVFYEVEVRRMESESLTIDGTERLGDWFDYYFDGSAIGGIWFERSAPETPASFNNYGGPWTEFWLNNGETLYPVPEQRFWLKPLKFNGLYPYTNVLSTYSDMPNSDTAYIPGPVSHGGYFDFKMGGDTERCHIDDASIDVTATGFKDNEVYVTLASGSLGDDSFSLGFTPATSFDGNVTIYFKKISSSATPTFDLSDVEIFPFIDTGSSSINIETFVSESEVHIRAEIPFFSSEINPRFPYTFTPVAIRREPYFYDDNSDTDPDGNFYILRINSIDIGKIWFENSSSETEPFHPFISPNIVGSINYLPNNDSEVLLDVPNHHIRIAPTLFSESIEAATPFSSVMDDSIVEFSYSDMPNSDFQFVSYEYYNYINNDCYFLIKFGGNTKRCNDAAVFDMSTLESNIERFPTLEIAKYGEIPIAFFEDQSATPALQYFLNYKTFNPIAFSDGGGGGNFLPMGFNIVEDYLGYLWTSSFGGKVVRIDPSDQSSPREAFEIETNADDTIGNMVYVETVDDKKYIVVAGYDGNLNYSNSDSVWAVDVDTFDTIELVSGSNESFFNIHFDGMSIYVNYLSEDESVSGVYRWDISTFDPVGSPTFFDTSVGSSGAPDGFISYHCVSDGVLLYCAGYGTFDGTLDYWLIRISLNSNTNINDIIYDEGELIDYYGLNGKPSDLKIDTEFGVIWLLTNTNQITVINIENDDLNIDYLYSQSSAKRVFFDNIGRRWFTLAGDLCWAYNQNGDWYITAPTSRPPMSEFRASLYFQQGSNRLFQTGIVSGYDPSVGFMYSDVPSIEEYFIEYSSTDSSPTKQQLPAFSLRSILLNVSNEDFGNIVEDMLVEVESFEYPSWLSFQFNSTTEEYKNFFEIIKTKKNTINLLYTSLLYSNWWNHLPEGLNLETVMTGIFSGDEEILEQLDSVLSDGYADFIVLPFGGISSFNEEAWNSYIDNIKIFLNRYSIKNVIFLIFQNTEDVTEQYVLDIKELYQFFKTVDIVEAMFFITSAEEELFASTIMDFILASNDANPEFTELVQQRTQIDFPFSGSDAATYLLNSDYSNIPFTDIIFWKNLDINTVDIETYIAAFNEFNESLLTSSRVYGPNVDLSPRDEGFDSLFNSVLMDSRYVQFLNDFIDANDSATPTVSSSHIAFSGNFSEANWPNVIDYVRSLTDRPLIISDINNGVDSGLTLVNKVNTVVGELNVADKLFIPNEFFFIESDNPDSEWLFEAYLDIPDPGANNCRLTVQSYSEDILGPIFVDVETFDATPVTIFDNFSISGSSLPLENLDPNLYTIRLYGDIQKSGSAFIRIVISSDNLDEVYLNDSTYLEFNDG